MQPCAVSSKIPGSGEPIQIRPPPPATRTRSSLGARSRRHRPKKRTTRGCAAVAELLDDLNRHAPPADFHQAVSFPLPALVICELLGVPYEDREDFRRWSDEAAATDDEARSIS